MKIWAINNIYFYQNNIQICTKIDEDTYFFGLGDDSINGGLNLLIGKGQKFNLYSNNIILKINIFFYNKLYIINIYFILFITLIQMSCLLF